MFYETFEDKCAATDTLIVLKFGSKKVGLERNLKEEMKKNISGLFFSLFEGKGM